jgi:hypothetical protein
MRWDDDTIRDFASQFVRDEVFGSDSDRWPIAKFAPRDERCRQAAHRLSDLEAMSG